MLDSGSPERIYLKRTHAESRGTCAMRTHQQKEPKGLFWTHFSPSGIQSGIQRNSPSKIGCARLAAWSACEPEFSQAQRRRFARRMALRLASQLEAIREAIPSESFVGNFVENGLFLGEFRQSLRQRLVDHPFRIPSSYSDELASVPHPATSVARRFHRTGGCSRPAVLNSDVSPVSSLN